MNKLSANLLAGAILISILSACNSGEKQAGTDPAAAVPTAPTAPAETPAPAPAPVQGLAVPFAEEVLTIPVGGYCSLDAVNGNAVANGRVEWRRSVPAVVGGWTTDQANAVPADPILVVHNESGRYVIPLSTGLARPDVAAALKNPALENAGYESPADLRDVPVGSYDLSIVTSADGRHRCPLNVVLALVD